MKSRVFRWFHSHVVALGITAALAIGASAGCAVAPDEPIESEPPATDTTVQSSTAEDPAAFQVVWQCFTPSGTRVGLPKSPLSACQAACASPNFCVRCVFIDNAVECE